MFSYKVSIAIVTTMALLQPPLVIAQDIAEVNNIAINISVKITGHSNGSGFILEREGNVYSVVTNKHVVPIDTEYEIQTYNGTKHQVTNRQEIPDLDLAIVQFTSTEEYQVAELGNSDELQQRQFISVAGFPGEQTDLDIIDGQIRSIRQEIIANPEPNKGYALIYTNQTLPGSSGGAVLDGKGLVIAINGEKSRDIKTGIDISRGIPINLFLEKLPQENKDQQILNIARELSYGNNVNAWRRAIAETSLISSNSPVYSEAQGYVRTWRSYIQRREDQPILGEAESFANINNFPAAIDTARKISSGRALYSEAQSRIAVWQKEIDGQRYLREANDLARQGTPESLARAINTARQVSANSSVGSQAMGDINDWARQILAIARQASNSSLSRAIEIARQVPSGTTSFTPAQKDIKIWQIKLNPPQPEEAQSRIAVWQKEIDGHRYLREANDLARQGTPESLARAINTARQVSANSSVGSQAMGDINDWARQILAIARQASNSSLSRAIEIARQVPSGTTSFTPAQKDIKIWQIKLNPRQ